MKTSLQATNTCVINYNQLVKIKTKSFKHKRKFLTLEPFFLLLHDDAWCTYEKIDTKMQHTIQQLIQMSLKRV